MCKKFKKNKKNVRKLNIIFIIYKAKNIKVSSPRSRPAIHYY